MILQDERTPEQKRYPYMIVIMTDRFMSGSGEANDGPSYVGWAVPESYLNAMESRVRNLPAAMRVRIVGPDYHPNSRPGHCHIYAWKE